MSVMPGVLDPIRLIRFVVLINYQTEKNKKKLPLEVYLKINKAQINKKNKHQIFVNVVS